MSTSSSKYVLKNFEKKGFIIYDKETGLILTNSFKKIIGKINISDLK